MRSHAKMLLLGLGGNDSEDGDTKDKDDEAERERLEAIKEAEDRRKEKHRKMELERENMRQDIRDKVITIFYHIKGLWALYIHTHTQRNAWRRRGRANIYSNVHKINISARKKMGKSNLNSK